MVYEICWYLRGLETWFMDMLTQPEFCEALIDQTLKFWMDWFRVFLDEVGDVVDVIMIGDDLAAQKGPLFRPEFYRRVVKPRHKQLVAVHPLADRGEDLVSHLRRVRRVHSRPAGQRHRHSQPGADQRQRDGSCRLEGPLRRSPDVLGRRDRCPARVAAGLARNRPRARCGGTWSSGSPAAATCSTTSITSRREFRAENIVAMYDAAYEFGFYE